ncbi:MAG TPA: tetratricopeptide repeat protein [Gemmataceae bacterium]|nr:tetratricopeptide repeat protein [Gemmataceae bacterium]
MSQQTETILDQAVNLIRSGQTVQAEELVQSALHAAEQQFGPQSAEYASALNDLATVHLYLRELPGAVAALRQACAIYVPDDYDAIKDRLTYLMNLSFALEQQGDLDEAERVLRDCVDGRRIFYGRQHAGYGFGLEPLADLLLRKGKLDEALKLIDETVDNFWRASHVRVATALALRAVILKAAGSDTPPFADLDGLPDEIIGQIADALINRVDYDNPSRPLRLALADLLELLTQRFPEKPELLLPSLQHIANLERHLGDATARVQAIRRAIAICEQIGKPEAALGTMQGLALALSESGQTPAAEQAYREALARADALGDAAARSQVLRNHGLFLAECQRRPDAEKLLREAVVVAVPSGDAEMLARARIALGIFLQHGGQLDGAKAILAEALKGIDPAHPDAIAARSHLGAVESGSSCGCGDQGKAVADACREFILARVPPGLLTELKVEAKDDNLQVQVQLDHEPSPEEMEQLERVLRHGVEAFRRKLRQPV